MPPALKQLLNSTDALIAKAKGAVAVAAKDIQKEVLYLAGKLDIANSADNRELVYKAVEKRIATLGSKLNTLFQYADDHAVIKANEQAAKATGVQVKISKRHANEIINAVQKAGGGSLAATMTANMQGNVITALRDSVVAAMREQALTGGSMKDLQATIRAKWEAAAKGAEGLVFVDRAGKVWDTDTYLNMNVRTNAMRVYNDALVNQIGKATGGDLVMVSRGGDPNCKHCFPWEGRILSITGKTKGFPTYDEARRAGCFHPNCTHTLEPVDEELDADEINLQRQFKPPADLADREAMDEQRYEMDIARKMQNDGLDATAAKVAVDRDNLADSLRQGLIVDGAEQLVASLTDEQVNALCPNGNPPEFLPPKWNGGVEAWNKGAAGGVLYAKGKTLTAEKLVKISGVGEGKPLEPVEPPKLENVFVGNSFAKQKAKATIESGFKAVDAAYDKASESIKAFDEAVEDAQAKWADAGMLAQWDETMQEPYDIKRQALLDERKEWLNKKSQLSTWFGEIDGLPDVPENKEAQAKADEKAAEIEAKAQAYIDEAEKFEAHTDWSAQTASAAQMLEKALKAKLDTARADAAYMRREVEKARQLRIKWHKEIEALAKAANIGRKWHGPVVAFRNTNRLYEVWVRNLNKYAEDTEKALASGNATETAKAHKELLDCWYNGGGAKGNDFTGQMATFESVYNQAKEYLEKLASGQAAPKREVENPRNDTPAKVDLKPYKFPESLTQAQVDELVASGRNLGGTTGAKMVELDGQRYMMKLGSNTSDEHLQNEMDANAAYRAAGCRVPDFKVYEVGGQKVALSQFIDGAKSLDDYMASATEEEKARVTEQLRRHFALDALFANHDVLGSGGDNVLVDGNGNAWRIDNGSAFGFRAQGAAKKAELWKDREWIDDLWTMRGLKPDGTPSGIGLPYGNGIYDGADFNTASILRSARGIDFDKALAALPKDTQKKLAKPLAELRGLIATGTDYESGKYEDGAASLAIDASYNFQRQGVVRDTIPSVAATSKASIDANFRGKVGDEASEYIGGVSENTPKPKTYSGTQIAEAIKKAAVSVNHHIKTGDFAANESTVAEALETEKALKELVVKWKGTEKEGQAQAYLDALETLKASKANGYKTEMPSVNAEHIFSWKETLPKKKEAGRKLTLTALVQDYVETDGGTKPADSDRYQLIIDWNKSQADDSWDGGDGSACKAKILELRARGLNPDPTSGGPNGEMYGKGVGKVASEYEKWWQYYSKHTDEYERDYKAFMQYKGCVYTVLSRTDFAGKQPDGTYLVCRTESNHKNMGLDEHEKGFCKVHSGACESTSVFSPFGNYMTVRRLPLSRANSCYFFGRSKDYNKLLLGDGENEITFDVNGDEPVYIYGGLYDSNESARKEFLEAEKKLKDAGKLEWAKGK